MMWCHTIEWRIERGDIKAIVQCHGGPEEACREEYEECQAVYWLENTDILDTYDGPPSQLTSGVIEMVAQRDSGWTWRYPDLESEVPDERPILEWPPDEHGSAAYY